MAKNIHLNDSHLSAGIYIDPKKPESSIPFDSGTNRSGNISITATGNISLENNSLINALSSEENAGNITIKGGNILRLSDESRIITAVNLGSEKGGDIFIDTSILAVNDSFITSKAVEGAGGDITILSHLFLSPLSSITASSKFKYTGEIKPKTRR
ncbi:MAG: hypothetical protein V3U87_06020 [Methylococcaceae bacterium]